MKSFKKNILALASVMTMAMGASAFAAPVAKPTAASISEDHREIACLFCCNNSCNGGGSTVV